MWCLIWHKNFNQWKNKDLVNRTLRACLGMYFNFCFQKLVFEDEHFLVGFNIKYLFGTYSLTFVIFISWCFWCLFHKIWRITNCWLLIVSICLWPNMYCLGFAASLVLSQTNQVYNLATASAIIEIIWILMQSSKLKNKIK